MPVLKNARQEAFCIGLAKGMTQSAAYKAAGYKPDRGAAARLSANVSVIARVRELQEEVAAQTVIDKAWVMRRLVQNEHKASQAQPVLDGNGKPTGEYRFDPAAVNRSLELVGKELGMFNTQRIEVKVTEQMDAFLADLEHNISRGAYLEVLAYVASTMGVLPEGSADPCEGGRA